MICSTLSGKAEQAIIDKFVNKLDENSRKFCALCVGVENSPDCQPIVLRHSLGPDKKMHERMLDSVEKLRRSLGIDYSILQPELQRRLYDVYQSMDFKIF